MIIKRFTIKNFGKLHDKSMELSPGINVLYGENESGKTTTHSFIKSMFYGVSRLRGRAAKNDSYSTYEPWNNPVVYGGILWFESGGKNFRVTRSFHKTCPSGEILCEDTGELLDVERGDMDRILGNISEAVYDNTVSVAQLKSVTGPELVRELQNYMASYQGTGDCSVDLGRAMQMLKMSRKGFQTQKEKKQKEDLKQQEKLAANMEYLRQEMINLDDKKSEVQDREATLQMGGGDENGGLILDQRIRSVGKKREILWVGMVTLAIVSVILLIGGDQLFPGKLLALRIGLVVLGAALVGLGFVYQGRMFREQNKWRKLKTRWVQRQEKLKWDKESLKEAYGEKETAYTNLEAEYREYETEMYMPTAEDMEIQALNMAMETIEAISDNIHNQVGGRLRERTSQILSEITGGKYQDVLMDADLHMTVNTANRTVPVERLSRGTIEQIYFALRMAAGELLCGKEQLPVILDDVFGMYDEERLTAVLHWLEKEQRQVIISTCHKREMEILDKEKIPYQKLILS